MAYPASLFGIRRESLSDGPGVRLVVVFQGCNIRCPGCHNEHIWEQKPQNVDDITQVFDYLTPLTTGITASGGEPTLQPEALFDLMREAKNRGLSTMIYSGKYLEQFSRFCADLPLPLLSYVDYVKLGPYDASERNTTLAFRGSSNQDIYKVREIADLYAFERVVLENGLLSH